MWSWFSFGCGVLAGIGLIYLAAALGECLEMASWGQHR